MRSVFFTFCLLCSLWNKTSAQANNSDEKLVQNVVVELFDALAGLNIQKAKSVCTNDVTILESGEIWNFDSLATRITAMKAKFNNFKRVNELSFLKTTIAGDKAWLYYRNQATITLDGKTIVLKWLESAVLKKENNNWRINLLHSTKLG